MACRSNCRLWVLRGGVASPANYRTTVNRLVGIRRLPSIQDDILNVYAEHGVVGNGGFSDRVNIGDVSDHFVYSATG